MVSGVTAPPKYKSNKRFFGTSSTSQHTTPPASPGHHQNSNHKKYSDNGMRPWPPTYKSDSSTSRPSSMENFRSLSSSSSAKFYHNNTTNGNNGHHAGSINNNNNNNYKNSIYEAKKFNYHSPIQQQHNGSNNGDGRNSPTSFNLSVGSGTNGQNNKDYYLMPPPYENSKIAEQNGTVFYEQDSNMMLKARDREKNRFRKLRYTQWRTI